MVIARELADERSWRIARDADNGGASPMPIEILEMRVCSLSAAL